MLEFMPRLQILAWRAELKTGVEPNLQTPPPSLSLFLHEPPRAPDSTVIDRQTKTPLLEIHNRLTSHQARPARAEVNLG